MKMRIDSAGNVHLANGGELFLRPREALDVMKFLKALEGTLRMSANAREMETQTEPEDVDYGDSA